MQERRAIEEREESNFHSGEYSGLKTFALLKEGEERRGETAREGGGFAPNSPHKRSFLPTIVLWSLLQ